MRHTQPTMILDKKKVNGVYFSASCTVVRFLKLKSLNLKLNVTASHQALRHRKSVRLSCDVSQNWILR